MFTKAQIAEALSLVIEIDNDQTDSVAFFEYSGHVKLISIRIYPSGWTAYSDDYVNFRSYEDEDINEGSFPDGTTVAYDTFEYLLEAVRKVGA